MKTKLINRDTKRGAYDMIYTRILIDHDTLGRVLLCEGFGGTDQLCGGAYRWRQGLALLVPPSATLESLDAEEAKHGPLADYYPVLDWDGLILASIAHAHEGK